MPKLFEYQGFGYASWWNGNFAAAASAQGLDEVVGMQANSVAITASYYMASSTSSDIYADAKKTESLANVARAVDDAHARGLSVLLKPHVDALDHLPRMQMAPTDVAAWFADYKAILMDYARMAEMHGAGMLSLGTEIDGLTVGVYRHYWVDIIDSIRAVYSGKLTYGANWDGAGKVSFWDKLDVVGVDGYVPVSFATEPSMADLVAGWTTVPADTYYRTIFEGLSPVDYYRQVAEQAGKPFIFTEIGYRSVDGAAARPFESNAPGNADAREQADLYQAFFQVFSQAGEWFQGGFIWHWSPQATAPTPTDYQTEGKPAEAVVRDWFSGNGSAVALPAVDRVLNGTAGDETLVGGLGNDVIDGKGSGSKGDLLVGGMGDDVFIVRGVLDRVSEQDGGGVDTVRTALASYTLPAYVETLAYTGTGNFAGIGNWLANTLIGGTGRDTLDGGGGADTLIGGLGDDTYIVDNAGDRVVEAAGAGRDLVISGISYGLGAHLEDLTLTGLHNISGTGNWMANRITGNAANNLLDGGGSTTGDTLAGGAGNDTYIVTNVGDRVIEAAGQGTDHIRTSLTSFDLARAAHVENLTYTGAAGFRGYGNELANIITGGSGNDTLYSVHAGDSLQGGGGNDVLFSVAGGADTLAGGLGDDMYVVRGAEDKVVEYWGAGFDTIRTELASFTLPANVESLIYTGKGDFAGTGSAGNDVIQGGAGNDTIIGGLGADTMKGFGGDDTFYVDNTKDVIAEWQNGGHDRVFSTASFTLNDNVEDLFLLGTGNLAGTGNKLANVLSGNVGNNRLDGAAGRDTLDGGAGADTLTGGLDADTFVFVKGEAGGDVIADFNRAQKDVIEFQGYAAGSTFTRLTGSATDWQVTDAADGHSEVIRLAGAPALLEADWHFA